MNNVIHLTRAKVAAIVLFSLLLFFTNNVLANTSINVGPDLGKKAPAITAINTLRQPVTIEQLAGEKGLIILFFRSADWCPF
ncbi:MAG: peroxiredoxin family protein, partial [Colwellia sp.]|nr:peroxiredoxin family protein [Colwellia sp.]